MHDIFHIIRNLGLVPTTTIDEADKAEALAGALCEAGLPCAEITFRTQAAEQAIRSIAKAFPQMLLGAGTVLTVEQAQRAVDAGANFLVTPGINPKLVSFCVDHGIPIAPGCCTPSNIELAMEYGLDLVKFFPAEPLGGVALIKSLAGPYSSMNFICSGGISQENLASYLSQRNVLACGASWIVDRSAILSGDFAKIKELTREALRTVQQARGGK